MSFEKKYPSLPGFMTEFVDGGLQVRTEVNPPATDSVLLLGTAVDGPIMEPVAVDSSTVELVFGRATDGNNRSNGSTLVKAYQEAYQAGCRDIRLMRISGAQAASTVKVTGVETTTDTPKSDILGDAPGNIETVFTLNQEVIIENSVSVIADGVSISNDDITVTDGSITPPATVTLAAGVTNQGASITIEYSYDDNGDTVTVVENGLIDDVDGSVTYWIAEGEETTHTLTATPKAGTLKLYADGVQVDGDAVSFTATTLTLASGFVQLGAQLEATYIYEETVTENPAIKLESIFGGFLYNQIKVKVEDIENASDDVIGKLVIIEKPAVKKAQLSDPPLQYSSLDYETFGAMIQAINGDEDNNIVRASTANRHQEIATSGIEAQPNVLFQGGNDGIQLTSQEKFEILGGTRDSEGFLQSEGAYQLLENYTCDMVVPLDVYADEVLSGKYDNFAYQLALGCAVMSHRNSTTVGVIATSSPDEAGLAAIQTYVTGLSSYANNYLMRDRIGNLIKDSDGEAIDLGRFISVIAGPDVVFNNPRLGVYAENSAAAYAGFVADLVPQSAPTNKALRFAQGLRFRYSNSQLDKLTGNRLVTLKTKNNGGIVAVTDAPTAAQATSDYRRLTTTRVVKEAVNEVRDVCDPYIGEPNEVAQRNAMTAAISKRLDQLQDQGVLVGYDFSIVVTQEMQLMGEAQIELTIVPPQELRRITTVVTLTPSL